MNSIDNHLLAEKIEYYYWALKGLYKEYKDLTTSNERKEEINNDIDTTKIYIDYLLKQYYDSSEFDIEGENNHHEEIKTSMTIKDHHLSSIIEEAETEIYPSDSSKSQINEYKPNNINQIINNNTQTQTEQSQIIPFSQEDPFYAHNKYYEWQQLHNIYARVQLSNESIEQKQMINCLKWFNYIQSSKEMEIAKTLLHHKKTENIRLSEEIMTIVKENKAKYKRIKELKIDYKGIIIGKYSFEFHYKTRIALPCAYHPCRGRALLDLINEEIVMYYSCDRSIHLERLMKSKTDGMNMNDYQYLIALFNKQINSQCPLNNNQ